jgi:hypothetical protein
MKMIPPGLAAAGLALEFCLLALRSLGDGRTRIPEAIAALLVSSIFYLVSVWLVMRREGECRAGRPFILFLSLIFRITVFPVSPFLSDDLYRYRWEGKVQASGINPYATSPVLPGGGGDETSRLIPSPHARSGYGPLWTRVEAWTFAAIAPWTDDPRQQAFWFKTPALAADLAAVVLLSHLAPGRFLLYAWCPLPVVEFWISGHNDACLIAFLLAALWAARRDRWWLAFAALTAAGLIKLWPFLLIPLFLVCPIGDARRRRWPALAVVPLISLVCAWPYFTDVGENLRFLSGFLGGWRNNDSLFGAVLWLTASSDAARRLSVFLILGLVAGLAWRRWPLEKSVLGAATGLLLLSANVHPWYLAWLVALLPLVFWLPAAVWVSLAPLFYAVLIDYQILGRWNGVRPDRWLVYVPFFLFAARDFAEHFRSRARKSL